MAAPQNTTTVVATPDVLPKVALLGIGLMGAHHTTVKFSNLQLAFKNLLKLAKDSKCRVCISSASDSKLD